MVKMNSTSLSLLGTYSRHAWSGRRDSDSRPSPWQGDALPTELLPQIFCNCSIKIRPNSRYLAKIHDRSTLCSSITITQTMSAEQKKGHLNTTERLLTVSGILVSGVLSACSNLSQSEPQRNELRANMPANYALLHVESEPVLGTDEIMVIVEWEQGRRTQLYRLIRLPEAISVITYATGTTEHPRVFSFQYDAADNLLLTLELFPDGIVKHATEE